MGRCNLKEIYRRKRIMIPTPKFFVFYNGNEPYPTEKIMKLSDSYLDKTDPPMLELIVKVININLPVNHPILQKCRPLYEYSWFIQKIREYQQEGMELVQAIACAMEDCTSEGIMVDFLKENGSEAVNMLFTEFNMEDALDVRYEEGLQAGMMEGSKATALDTAKRMLQDGRFTPEEIAEYVSGLTIEEILALK